MEKRKATYSSAVRMVELTMTLSRAWRPLSIENICEQLGISKRTAQRYRKALNDNLSSEDGGKFIRVQKEDSTEKWYLADQEEILTATFFKLISIYVAMALLKSMQGTVIEEGLKSLWDLTSGQLRPSLKKQLEGFGQKFRYSGFALKDYSPKNEIIAQILKCLIHQKKLQILHYSHASGREKYHIVHPYTLLLHRDSLYLHGYSEDHEEIRTFLVDRILSTAILDRPFKYPSRYNPDSITEGSFGVFRAGDEATQKIRIACKPILHEYLTTRTWHKTQQFSQIEDGRFIMEISLKNTHELISWILQFGSDAVVLEPESLRQKVKKELLKASGQY